MKKTSLELRLWRWQRTSALALLPLLAFHIAYQYFYIGKGGLAYSVVSARLNMALFLAIDILLLLSVAIHAFLGLRSIAMDYASSPAAGRRGTTLILALLAGTVIYGLAALFAFM